MDVRKLTALEIGALIAARKISSPEVMDAFLAAARADMEKDPADTSRINAYISVDEEAARASAAAAQKRIDSASKLCSGSGLSPLAGVPVAVKDNLCVQGGATTAASKILENFRPPYSATVVEKLTGAGAAIIGKTNLDEFAMGGSTETSHYGPTRNPWDTARVPGGSSGGSAAAVAAGLAPYAIGSDTGGSIRQPAAFCGLTGIKPTYGSVSRFGLLAYASSLDQIGPMGHTARDCAAALAAVSGPDSRDSTSIADKPFFMGKGGLGEDAAAQVKGLKIGLPKDYFGAGLAQDVKAAVLGAAKKLEGLGAIVEEFDLPLMDYAVPAYYIIACAEASSNLSRYDGVKFGYRSPNATDIRESFFVTRSEGFGTEVKRRILLGSFVLSSGYFDAYYKKALKVRRLIRNAFDEALTRFDIILGPVSPTVAYEIGGQIADPLAMYMADIYTVCANLTGLPAVSLPCGQSADGLPIGMQMLGRAFSDELLLAAADGWQGATDYHKKLAY
jgi:aspartyl-tRNA(Asn)/glutamyl-tRNA(Gln) amidotransferase subunit A